MFPASSGQCAIAPTLQNVILVMAGLLHIIEHPSVLMDWEKKNGIRTMISVEKDIDINGFMLMVL